MELIDLIQWFAGLGLMGIVLLIIRWDHRVTKREEKERARKEQEENEMWWV